MSHPATHSTLSNRRSLSEQIVGLSIIALCSFAFALLFATFFRQGALWYETLERPIWSVNSSQAFLCFSTLHACFAFSFWMIWKDISLRTLKLELSIFLSCFLLETIWGASLYLKHQFLLSLITLLIWMCAAIVLSALFWKRKKIAGKILIIPILWILYLISIHMIICIANNYS